MSEDSLLDGSPRLAEESHLSQNTLPRMEAVLILLLILGASDVKRFDFAPMRIYRREIGIVWHPRLVSIRPQSESVLAGLKQIEA